MDLSILIPVFNWDVTCLLRKLLDEIDGCSLVRRVEVIVMDDCSTAMDIVQGNEKFIDGNRCSCLHYSRFGNNSGRSAIRNTLARRALGRCILFLDSDVLPDSDRFIRNYLAVVDRNEHDVVCGGLSYTTRILQGSEYDFSAYFGKRKEVKAADQRNAEPWRHILTSNVMVRKSTYQEVPFDERFVGYGYEDIEWGIRLAERWRVLHIDNTVSHLGLVSKAKALEKMRMAVPNYLMLRKLHPGVFAGSTIGKVARFFTVVPENILAVLDRFLAKAFLVYAASGMLAFILFQLDYAVLLASELKHEGR